MNDLSPYTGPTANDNRRFLAIFPNIPGEDYALILPFLERLTEQQAKEFLRMYSENRLDAQTFVILGAFGFIGFHGVQRFYIGDWGMGIVHLLTCGLFLLGTIYDMATGSAKIREINLEKIRGIYSNYGNPFDVGVI